MSKTETKDLTEKQNVSGGGKGLKLFKNVLNVIINILIVAVLVVSILVAVLALTSKADPNGIPNVFGYTLQYVQAPSMDKPSPDGYGGGNFTEEDVIIGKVYKDNAELNVGDIVTYNSHQEDQNGNERMIAHRIVDKKQMSDGSFTYQTWGDNRDVAQVPDQLTEEEYLRPYDIVSVIYTDEYKGATLKGFAGFFRTIRSPGGFFGIILVPMIIFFLYAIVRVVISAMNYKKGKEEDEKEEAEKQKKEEIDAAVAAALAEKNNSETKPEDMTPEQMEEFKKFLEFKKAQEAQESPAPEKEE